MNAPSQKLCGILGTSKVMLEGEQKNFRICNHVRPVFCVWLVDKLLKWLIEEFEVSAELRHSLTVT